MISLNKFQFTLSDTNSFQRFHHDRFHHLLLYPALNELERIAGLACDLAEDIFGNKCELSITHGDYASFLAYETFPSFTSVTLNEDTETIRDNIMRMTGATNVHICRVVDAQLPDIMIVNQDIQIHTTCFVISLGNNTYVDETHTKYSLTNSEYVLYVPSKHHASFLQHFHYYIKYNTTLDYNNLAMLCVMVKNGGPLFRKMLEENVKWIDRWTILDTGSTDDTIKNIQEVLVGKKKGLLVEEPFINFRESRNRCLDLAGTRCKFNVMLDDTYIMQGPFREFMKTVRSDQFADSYSIIIKSDDTEYCSCRITKSKENLRYIYTIHEVITPKNNVNVFIPPQDAMIDDQRADYMEKRTMERKEYDLKCLFEMVKEYPDEPRHTYYIAQTYNLIEKYELAAEYFYKRVFDFPPELGLAAERYDALFEMIRLYNFKLNKPWDDCLRYYLMLHELDNERPEAAYFIGVNHYLKKNFDEAFKWLKIAFNIGYPVHKQYGLKPTLSYHFCPKFLAELSYMFTDFHTGYRATTLFLQKNTPNDKSYQTMVDWHSIFTSLLKMPPVLASPREPQQSNIFAFVADGGFTKWSGSDILSKGVGGSETFIIEMARYILEFTKGNTEVVVFCNCDKEEIFEGVKYVRLERFFETAATLKIKHCMISRYSEYIPVAIHGHVENIHVILHDTQLTGQIIPMHPKLKNIFCLTEWHRQLFLKNFPQFDTITHAFHYGIDFSKFQRPKQRVPQRFIYSSFPNRGLIVVLQMWRRIKQRYPHASLHVYTDVYNGWSNKHYPDELIKIRQLLMELANEDVVNYGWVSKQELAQAWSQADIWFYPCKFSETFCLTALEAALSQTFVVTNNLAALQCTVGNRGVCIEGNQDEQAVLSKVWQDKAFSVLCTYLDNPAMAREYVQANYEWARQHSWIQRAQEFLTMYTPDLII